MSSTEVLDEKRQQCSPLKNSSNNSKSTFTESSEGLAFLQFVGPKDLLHSLFLRLNFEHHPYRGAAYSSSGELSLFTQGSIAFFVYSNPQGYAKSFYEFHGASIVGMGLLYKESEKVFSHALRMGAKEVEKPSLSDFMGSSKSASFETVPLLSFYGVGKSEVYLLSPQNWLQLVKNYFPSCKNFEVTPGVNSGKRNLLSFVDHLTNNVSAGDLELWCQFYREKLGFSEIRDFYIRGQNTGLDSRVLKAPNYDFYLPINEPTDRKSQIQEYLDEYKGAGIQHIALHTNNIFDVVKNLREKGVPFLKAPPDTYYRKARERVPHFKGDLEALKNLGILVDGNEKGHLLQIFTKPVVGPIFFEIIQRDKHEGFGEGNFQALFDAIEEDQRERGFLT